MSHRSLAPALVALAVLSPVSAFAAPPSGAPFNHRAVTEIGRTFTFAVEATAPQAGGGVVSARSRAICDVTGETTELPVILRCRLEQGGKRIGDLAATHPFPWTVELTRTAGRIEVRALLDQRAMGFHVSVARELMDQAAPAVATLHLPPRSDASPAPGSPRRHWVSQEGDGWCAHVVPKKAWGTVLDVCFGGDSGLTSIHVARPAGSTRLTLESTDAPPPRKDVLALVRNSRVRCVGTSGGRPPIAPFPESLGVSDLEAVGAHRWRYSFMIEGDDYTACGVLVERAGDGLRIVGRESIQVAE